LASLAPWEHWANSDSIDFDRGKRLVGLSIVSAESRRLSNIQNRYIEVKIERRIFERRNLIRKRGNHSKISNVV